VLAVPYVVKCLHGFRLVEPRGFDPPTFLVSPGRV